MRGEQPDRERFLRVVGKRCRPEPGAPPSAEARDALSKMARYLTRAPKGVFIYTSHEEANRDRDRWLVEAMVEKRRERDQADLRVLERAREALRNKE